jgi:hypothetical protein
MVSRILQGTKNQAQKELTISKKPNWQLPLQPPETAMTLYWKNGRVATTDRPYAETFLSLRSRLRQLGSGLSPSLPRPNSSVLFSSKSTHLGNGRGFASLRQG